MRLTNCSECPCMNSDNEDGNECNLGYSTGYVDAIFLIDEKIIRVKTTMSPDCQLLKISMSDHEDILPDIQIVSTLNEPRFLKQVR